MFPKLNCLKIVTQIFRCIFLAILYILYVIIRLSYYTITVHFGRPLAAICGSLASVAMNA